MISGAKEALLPLVEDELMAPDVPAAAPTPVSPPAGGRGVPEQPGMQGASPNSIVPPPVGDKEDRAGAVAQLEIASPPVGGAAPCAHVASPGQPASRPWWGIQAAWWLNVLGSGFRV